MSSVAGIIYMVCFVTQFSNANKHNYADFIGCCNSMELSFSVSDSEFQNSLFQLLAVKVISNGSYKVDNFLRLLKEIIKVRGEVKLVCDDAGVEYNMYPDYENKGSFIISTTKLGHDKPSLVQTYPSKLLACSAFETVIN